jgi:hypothetical protein
MKNILLTVYPSEAVQLLNGTLSVLVRSWKVPLGTAYIYCSKPKKKYRIGCMVFFSDELYRTPKGEIKFGSSVELMAYDNYDKSNFLSGKVVAKCGITDCKKVSFLDWRTDEYTKPMYHHTLSSLTVFDKPMELRQFKSVAFLNRPFKLSTLKDGETISKSKWEEMARITRSPQSWQYVEVGE